MNIIQKLEKLLADPNGRNAIRAAADDINQSVKETAEDRERRRRIIAMLERREAEKAKSLKPLPHNATAQAFGKAGSCENAPERTRYAEHVRAGGVKKVKKDGTVIRYTAAEAAEVNKALITDSEWKDRAATAEHDYI